MSAGLSTPSSTRNLADQLTAAAIVALSADGPVEAEVLELRDLAHQITDHMLTGFSTGELAQGAAAVEAAHALIVVTPTFSASYSGLFKSFFDVLEPDALVGKPVLLAATGGTARHSLVLEYAMRPLFSYLNAAIVPTGVYAAVEDFGTAGLAQRVSRAASELAVAVRHAPVPQPLDAFDDVSAFAQHLQGGISTPTEVPSPGSVR